MAKRNLAHAATLLPLVIGLAMNGKAPSPPSPSSSTASTHRTSPGRRSAAGGGGQPFVPLCSLPFDGSRNPDIDSLCPLSGGGTGAAKQAQSQAKNNLCAAKGPAQRIAYEDLVQKQKDVTNVVNLSNLTNRSVLESHGEGTYVEYVAFIQDAHYSDVSSGEAVNCNIPGDSTNDIHIVLVQSPNDDPCLSTTAEMIPHFRPEGWTADNVDSVREHPVRVRGTLFYDDAHKPCSGSSRPSPNRISVWEIHPVYSLDVCSKEDLTQCQSSTDPADWSSLEDWLKNPM